MKLHNEPLVKGDQYFDLVLGAFGVVAELDTRRNAWVGNVNGRVYRYRAGDGFNTTAKAFGAFWHDPRDIIPTKNPQQWEAVKALIASAANIVGV